MGLFFNIVVTIAVILILVAAILAVLATVSVLKSPQYPSNPKVKAAHGMLLASDILGWLSLAVVMILLIIGVATNAFTVPNYGGATSDLFEDISPANTGYSQLKSGNAPNLLIYIGFFVVLGMTLALVATLWLAAGDLTVTTGVADTFVAAARAYSIWGVVFAVLAVIAIVLCLVAFFSIRGQRGKAEAQISELGKV